MSGPTLDTLFDSLISPTGILPSSSELSRSLRLSNPQVMSVHNPNSKLLVWPLSRSLAATRKIDVSFSSSGYLDVSVPRVPFHTLWIGVWIREVCSRGFPHSEICGSQNICFSPQLIAACHVLRRLSVPRHPPCALYSLTFIRYIALYLTAFFDFHHFGLFLGLAYLIVYAAPRMSKHY